jgi:hypothetical protein
MNEGKLVFSQLLFFLPKRQFRRIVERYQGNYNVKKFTCWDQFICMMFAQLTQRESLRDIEICLRSFRKKLYHCGVRSSISRSTLAYANDNRDWKIYKEFASLLIKEARTLYVDESFGVELENTVYAFDASTIVYVCRYFHGLSFEVQKQELS